MEKFCDLLYSVPFDIAECEHLGGHGVQLCQRGGEPFPEFRCRMFAVRIRPAFLEHQLTVAQSDLTSTGSDDVQRDIDCGPVQVCRPTTSGIGKPLASDQPEEQSLKYVFSVGRISRNSKCRLVHHLVIVEECLFDLGRAIGIRMNFNLQLQLLAVSVSIYLTLRVRDD